MEREKRQNIVEIEYQPIDITIRFKLLWEKNRNLCEALLSYLPYTCIQFHSVIAGYQVYHYSPIVEAVYFKPETTELLPEQPNGRVVLGSFELLGIKYGEVTEPLAPYPIGQVLEEDMEKLGIAAKKIWEAEYRTKEIITATVRLPGQKEKRDFSIAFNRTGNSAADQLIEEIYAETRKIWLTPPEELVDMTAGRLEAGVGPFEQAFTPIVFTNGEIRHLNYVLSSILQIASQENCNVEALQNSLEALTSVNAMFIGYIGMKKLGSFVGRAIEIGGAAKSREELVELYKALTTYSNYLHGWSMQLFPWYHGDDHPVTNR